MNFRIAKASQLPSILAALATVALLFLHRFQPTTPTDLSLYLLSTSRAPSTSAIASFLAQLARTCATPAKLSTYGGSTRGFPLLLLQLGSPNQNYANRTVLVTSGMHGREFQAPVATLLAILALCSKPLPNVSILVAPLTNPDGYERARTKIRIARKTWPLTTHPCPAQKTDGVDLNRNFPSAWAPSNDNCSVTYSGTGALSEPEARSLAALIRKYRTSIFAHIDVHSFGGILFHGRANGVGGDPHALRVQQALAVEMHNRLGDEYMPWDASIDPILRVRRRIGGTLMDFVTDLGIPCVVMELAPKWTMANRANGFFEGNHMARTRGVEVKVALDVLIEAAKNPGKQSELV